MMFIMKYIVGLGNPGAEYEGSRHNIGRDIVFALHKKGDFEPWQENKKTNATEAEGKIGKEKVTLILPNTFMNLSGRSVAKYVTSKKKLQDLIVVYDDIDLPIGSLKLSHNKGTGGHKGIDSMVRSLGSKEFARLRVGIVPVTPTGKMRKPKGERQVVDHVLGGFSPNEEKAVTDVTKRACEALELFLEKGYILAANLVN